MKNGASNTKEFPSQAVGQAVSQVQREQVIRTWVAQKESVCPYAPGLARFLHLPELPAFSDTRNRNEFIYYLAKELQAFYADKEKGKRVGRWMLLPHQDWQSHEEAFEQTEMLFWSLNAAYYHLFKDKKGMKGAFNRSLPGYQRGYQGEVMNPIIGRFPSAKNKVIPAKSLFCSALSSVYQSQKFYRYCPHSVMVMVYVSEFEELKQKHLKVSREINLEMAYTSLFERFGDDLDIDIRPFERELTIWGAIVDRVAQLERASAMGQHASSHDLMGCPASNLQLFRNAQPESVNQLYAKNQAHLSILKYLTHTTHLNPKQIISGSFAGTGLYTLPDYPNQLPVQHGVHGR